MPIELTDKEIAFLLQLMRQTTVNPTAPEAVEVVATVQSIMQKITPAKGVPT